jgi:hypothetical protein
MFQTHALRFLGFVLLPGALIVASVGPTPAQISGQGSPMEITTDTPEYCQELLHRVGNLERLATAPVPHEVTDLTSEGQRMCNHGQTRSGIMRVRSALMLLEKGTGSAYR